MAERAPSRVRHLASAAAIAASLVALLGPNVIEAQGAYRYERAGEFLDFAKRPSLLKDFSPFAKFKIGKRGQGVYEVYPDGRRFFDPIDSAGYGLWHFTQYVKTERRFNLRQAERAARWLRRRQDPVTGVYQVPYAYDAGARDDGTNHLVLTPPWYGANVQGFGLMLLTRLYRETHRKVYLREANLALQPLARPMGAGGVQAPFFGTGETFFEGYATLQVPVHTLVHHVHATLGLYDMSDLSPLARSLFDSAMRTLRVALPHYDLPQGRVGIWLAHLTDPPRPVMPLIGNYQEGLVAFLRALDSVRPDPVVRHYRAAWEAQLRAICRSEAEGCFFRH